ncbi:hypothetical protein THAOC_34554 [Thalassiosira oceanica]|uniref:RxLR effector protein n=1 Tax=Thalassiosira oceanica TaxID=159749 RepID=K0R4T2_THAOC|nr:hypothetical protein THAOC_34554 [Thalassiosira oceanica]|eukprot:EJK46764.1 hypothetical protein THAOC_34554 [Thalassiosira oceanica]
MKFFTLVSVIAFALESGAEVASLRGNSFEEQAHEASVTEKFPPQPTQKFPHAHTKNSTTTHTTKVSTKEPIATAITAASVAATTATTLKSTMADIAIRDSAQARMRSISLSLKLFSRLWRTKASVASATEVRACVATLSVPITKWTLVPIAPLDSATATRRYGEGDGGERDGDPDEEGREDPTSECGDDEPPNGGSRQSPEHERTDRPEPADIPDVHGEAGGEAGAVAPQRL